MIIPWGGSRRSLPSREDLARRLEIHDVQACCLGLAGLSAWSNRRSSGTCVAAAARIASTAAMLIICSRPCAPDTATAAPNHPGYQSRPPNERSSTRHLGIAISAWSNDEKSRRLRRRQKGVRCRAAPKIRSRLKQGWLRRNTNRPARRRRARDGEGMEISDRAQ